MFDEERDMGVAHVMEPARLADRGVHCGFPEPGAEAGALQWPPNRVL